MKPLFCFCVILAKLFNATGKALSGLWLAFSIGLFLLWTCVIPVSFRLWGNTLFSIDSLNSLCKKLAERLGNFCNILGGILLLVVAFLGLVLLISFLISLISTVLIEILPLLWKCFCIKGILGRKLHFSVAFSMGWLHHPKFDWWEKYFHSHLM